MPYCPSCGYEFVDGKTVCPDCDVPLQATPPEEAPPEAWVVLERISQRGEGRILRGLLEANNIPAVVEDISFDMIPGSSEDLTQIRVLVKERDVKRARELLASAPIEEDMEEPSSDD